jgi:uncharacterized membrane protein
MNWSRARLKEMARIALHGSYWKSVVVSLILGIAIGGSGGFSGSFSASYNHRVQEWKEDILSPESYLFLMIIGIIVLVFAIFSLALKIFLLNPLEVSAQNFFRQDLYRPVGLESLTAGFTPNYWNVVKTQLLRSIFTFLWSLLFIIPGIVKHYEYLMMPYIQAEHPEMSSEEVFHLSREMMYGEKWNAFVLDLSFIPWNLLNACTLGILGIFYVNPYINLTHSALYGALSQNQEMKEQTVDRTVF